MRKLDKSKDYGTIHGQVSNNARFVQNGFDYDVNGDLLGNGKQTADELLMAQANKEAKALSEKANAALAEVERIQNELRDKQIEAGIVEAPKEEVPATPETPVVTPTALVQEKTFSWQGEVFNELELRGAHHMKLKAMLKSMNVEYVDEDQAVATLLG